MARAWLDEGEFESAIINISINSMHAMDNGGLLTIKSRNTTVNESDSRYPRKKAGDYVLLSITDTGCGIDEKIQEKIFDPFFSSKGDKGTGLGLSQVYGFIQRSGGYIDVISKPDHGTSLSLYLPRYDDSNNEERVDEPEKHINISDDNPDLTKTILVVDDEPALIELLDEFLSMQGYRIFCASNPKVALEILKKESIDLVLSDIVMPEMDGYELAAIVEKKYPDIKIQLVSGFSDEKNASLVNNNLHHDILFKPYDMPVLMKRIRKLLEI